MPEGPEIRLAADSIASAVVDRPTTAVYFAFEALKPYEEALTGQIVTAIETYGKAILTRFDNGLNIYSHNQLYGKWMVRPAGSLPDTNRQLRLAIHNQDHSALLYSASDIEVLHDHEVDEHPFISKIGPDLLDPDVTREQVASRLLANAFRRRRLSTLLLDQGFLAGVGNYLRSEILFLARVAPDQRPIDLSPIEINRLADAAIKLTRQSYQTRGITNRLKLVEKLKEEGWSRTDYRFRVFNREGRSCFDCGTPIVKGSASGRRIYTCPTCQQS